MTRIAVKNIEPARSEKVTRIIGIVLLIFGVVIFFWSLGAGSAVAFVLSIILIIISLTMIIRAGRTKEQETIKVKNHSKAKHGFVIFLYFLAALVLCYGLYSEFWLAGESLMESVALGIPLLIIGGSLDERFRTILWIRDIIANRQKKR